MKRFFFGGSSKTDNYGTMEGPIGEIFEVHPVPKKINWFIFSFFTEIPKKINYSLISPEFNFLEYTCRLVAYPNGTNRLPNIMLIKLAGIGKCHAVRWKLEVSRADGTILRKSGGWKKDGCEVEMNMFIPCKEILTGCYIQTYVKVTCTLYTEDDIAKETDEKIYKDTGCETESTSRFDKLSSDLEDLFFTGYGSNVTFRVENEEFKAHRSILGARTPVFNSMFKYKMSENTTGIVNIDDCDANTFREFLRYVYSGTVAKLNPTRAFELYKVADKYQMNYLKPYCVEYVKNNLSVDTFCDAAELSLLYDEEELKTIVTEFLSKNMDEINSTQGQKLECKSGDATEHLLKILKRND